MLRLLNSISEKEPPLTKMLEALEISSTFTDLILSAWHLAMYLTTKLVEAELEKRAMQKRIWGKCEHCGRHLQSKGFRRREMKTLIGKVIWRRRVGRCPNKCKLGQVAPLDKELGLEAYQRTSFEIKHLALIATVFLPFDTAALFVKQFTNVKVSSASIWWWVQDFGSRAKNDWTIS